MDAAVPCPRCQHENLAGAKFCNGCGARLELACPACKHTNLAERGEAHYRQALALAEPRGMRPLIAHCHLGLGKLYRCTDKREQAHEHLTTATAMYRDMDMRFWLEQVEAGLTELR
ncbi:MAG: double zinc ribbon domain-containing protein [Candidatus Rokuibacteriota bacterium]